MPPNSFMRQLPTAKCTNSACRRRYQVQMTPGLSVRVDITSLSAFSKYYASQRTRQHHMCYLASQPSQRTRYNEYIFLETPGYSASCTFPLRSKTTILLFM